MKPFPLSRWRPQNCLAVVGMLTIGCLSSGPWRQASAEGFGPTQASSSVDLTASPSQSSCGDKVTLDAMVSPAGATGSVEFFDFGTSLGSTPVAADGSAELSVSGLPGGSHSLTATYSGDANYTDSTSPPVGVQVSPLPSSVTLTSDVNPSLCGQKVNLIAHVEPVGATGTVQFVWIVPRQPPATIGYAPVGPSDRGRNAVDHVSAAGQCQLVRALLRRRLPRAGRFAVLHPAGERIANIADAGRATAEGRVRRQSDADGAGDSDRRPRHRDVHAQRASHRQRDGGSANRGWRACRRRLRWAPSR
jgi:hypothetical protein